jgi:glutathione S-transferase
MCLRDLVFTMWNIQIAFFMSSRMDEYSWNSDGFPHFTRWQNACSSRESLKKALSVFGETEIQSS